VKRATAACTVEDSLREEQAALTGHSQQQAAHPGTSEKNCTIEKSLRIGTSLR
jgi:hypothetical protein